MRRSLGVERPDWPHVRGGDTTSVYASTADTSSVAAGRTSYALDLHGPCVTIDTACSEALVAQHVATASALARGECTDALVESVSLKLHVHVSVLFARAGMLSVDGRCKTFDFSGFARGEGAAFVAAAPARVPARARRHADVGASAVRQDGRSAASRRPTARAAPDVRSGRDSAADVRTATPSCSRPTAPALRSAIRRRSPV